MVKSHEPLRASLSCLCSWALKFCFSTLKSYKRMCQVAISHVNVSVVFIIPTNVSQYYNYGHIYIDFTENKKL